jgi:hypothetical protein
MMGGMRLAISMLFLAPLFAQQGPANLKVLKPTDNVRAVMQTFTTGLGVRCDFCHVQGDFANDSKPEKLTARKMYTMMQQVNADLGGEPKVSCYTCHRGSEHPQMTPPAGAAPGR